MTQREIQEELLISVKGFGTKNLRNIIIGTAITCSTVLAGYYDFKSDLKVTKIEIELINARLERLEKRDNIAENKKEETKGVAAFSKYRFIK